MKLSCKGIVDGYFDDRFGARGKQFLKHKPNRSFELSWEGVPSAAQSLALLFIDHDAIPVCGFSWIHWTVANIDPKTTGLAENASAEASLLEGITSWAAPLLPNSKRLSHEDATGFGGCAPPDKDHCYNLELYALDTPLSLQPSFYLNELLTAMSGHILTQTTLQGWYKRC